MLLGNAPQVMRTHEPNPFPGIVVDDDESVRESLPDLLREFGFACRAFSSAGRVLASDYVDQTNCLIPRHRDAGHDGPIPTGIEISSEERSGWYSHTLIETSPSGRDASN